MGGGLAKGSGQSGQTPGLLGLWQPRPSPDTQKLEVGPDLSTCEHFGQVEGGRSRVGIATSIHGLHARGPLLPERSNKKYVIDAASLQPCKCVHVLVAEHTGSCGRTYRFVWQNIQVRVAEHTGSCGTH